MTSRVRQHENLDPISELKARARALATQPISQETEETWLELVEFMLAGERYAIELKFIREVYPLKGLTYLPGTPAFISGILNVRGEIVSVVNLKVFFELPETAMDKGGHVIILSGGEMEFGILADRIIGVTKIIEATLQQSLPTLTDIREKYLKGVADGCIAILDGNRLLSDRNLHVCQEA